ncbi:TPA: terminase small subunit, partial [Streptococcus agalactiae]|nr:terminase small subunit [Streptococcus agalactiae]HEN6657441.1 terminase small subunit [Streptococcus agalactiae]
MGKLTLKQQKFIDEYIICGNATDAAIKAGYSKKTAGQIGEQNLKKLEIKQAIQSR